MRLKEHAFQMGASAVRTGPGELSNPREHVYATRWTEAFPFPIDLSQQARQRCRRWTLSFLAALSRVRKTPFLKCLYCHYVFDDQRDEFQTIIQELKDLGTFVDTHSCIAMLKGEKRIDSGYFHLSFDDGFRNVITNAVPVLEKLNVPAMMFVPTRLMGADWGTTREYCARTTNFRAVIEMARWEDLVALDQSLFEVGSHTRTHARFSEMSSDASKLEDEIAGSKKDLEQRLAKECKYISWPYGRLADADGRSLEFARRAGYDCVFGAYRGSILPGRTDPFSIPRHHFEVHWPLSHIRYFAGSA